MPSSATEARPDVRAAIYRELYRFFVDRHEGRRGAPAAPVDVPRPVARALLHVCELIRRDVLASVDLDLADELADQLSSWLANLWADLRDDEPPAARVRSAERPPVDPRSAETGSAAPSPREAVAHPPTTEELLSRADAYSRAFPALGSEWMRVKTRIRHASLAGARWALAGEIESLRTRARTQAHDLLVERAIRHAISPLADHLNDRLPRLAEWNRLARRVFGRPGTWGVLEPTERVIAWDRLLKIAETVDREPALSERVADIVRGSEAPSHVEVTARVPVETVLTSEYDLGLGDIQGLERSSSLRHALPSEAALLATPETEDLFAGKLAEDGLLSLHHRRRARTVSYQRDWAVRTELVRASWGPVYVCVDTSGSMRGVPERIVQALLLAFARASLTHNRTVHVSAVLDAPVSFTVASASMPARVSEEVVRGSERLFSRSLGRGADVGPALESALGSIEAGPPTSMTDLVVISDMRSPRIAPSRLERIERLQRRGMTTVTAITIGERPIHDPLHVFDVRLHYNTALHLPGAGIGSPRMLGFASP